MYLSKLELIGFKSFAQKTKLKFTDGISCVIGPNGSGKSNIVDAIRWVLGEQKVSTLRTDRMESVIFNGSKDKKPLNMAEVALTVHNNKNILASEFTDVVISRRLYRSGESQYFINKSPCRLKDIQNLFMDTGMGSNSYSVIELSMVENIISENPTDRRHLFEEAAGVTKYKTRRKSALRKLDSTLQDMSRIEDIISEISRNVNSLSRQVGKARRFLKYQDELKKLDTELSRYRYALLFEEIQPLKKNLEEISLIKEDTSQQITLEEAILEDYKRELIQSEQKISDFGRQLYEIEKNLNQIKEETAIGDTRSRSLQDNIKRNNEEIEQYKDRTDSLNVQLNETRNKKDQASKTYQELKSKYESQNHIAKELKKQLEVEKNTLDSLNKKYKDQFNRVSDTKQIFQQKKYELNWNQDQIRIFNSEKEGLSDNKSKLKSRLEEIIRIKSEKDSEKERLNNESNKVKKEFRITEQNLREIEDNILSNHHQKENLESQLSFYENVLSSYQGHLESTRELMMNRSKFPGLKGPVSEILTTPDKYAYALEATLGDAVNYLVVDTVHTAQKIIEYVHSQKIGRTTIIPLDKINKIKVEDLNNDGNENFLARQVKSKTEYKTIIQLLVGDVCIVQSLSEAISQSEKTPHLRYVTLRGELITKSHAISGGQDKDSHNPLIGRKEQIENIKTQLKELHTNTDQLQSDKKIKIDIVEKNNTKMGTIESELELLENVIKELEKNKTEVNLQIKNNDTINDKRESEKKETSFKLSRLKEEVFESEKRVKNLENDLIAIEKQIIDDSDKFADRELKVETETELLNKINVEYITASNIYDNLEKEIVRIQNDITELQNQHNRRTQEIQDMETEISSIDEAAIQRSEGRASLLEQKSKFDQEKAEIEQEYHEIKDKILNLENQIKKYRKQHDSSLERTRHLELEIQENEIKSETIKERINEEYNEDISVGIPFDGLNVDESEGRIESLKQKIKQMGQVNPLAVSEYERESERLDFYTKQFNDLKEAEKSLTETINKINITARKQFKDTFEDIKKNFEKVFESFFENGEGTLKMEDNSDSLEANIDILVTPKGKRMQTISLLSGGEKTLTAISLLFSIYLVKPSPFCILDEIDAPLDDVNIGRFTNALDDFSKDTQFIVVTHNKRTMEAAGTLYGVTMEEEGLSKLVSVKFN